MLGLNKIEEYIDKIAEDYPIEVLPYEPIISRREAKMHGYFAMSVLLMEEFLLLNKEIDKELVTCVTFKMYNGELRMEYGCPKYQVVFNMQRSKSVIENNTLKFILNNTLKKRFNEPTVDFVAIDKIEKILSLYNSYKDIMKENLYLHGKAENYTFLISGVNEKTGAIYSNHYYQNHFRTDVRTYNHIKYQKSFPSKLEGLLIEENISLKDKFGLKKDNGFKI